MHLNVCPEKWRRHQGCAGHRHFRRAKSARLSLHDLARILRGRDQVKSAVVGNGSIFRNKFSSIPGEAGTNRHHKMFDRWLPKTSRSVDREKASLQMNCKKNVHRGRTMRALTERNLFQSWAERLQSRAFCGNETSAAALR
jgi:hypothetical protein